MNDICTNQNDGRVKNGVYILNRFSNALARAEYMTTAFQIIAELLSKRDSIRRVINMAWMPCVSLFVFIIGIQHSHLITSIIGSATLLSLSIELYLLASRFDVKLRISLEIPLKVSSVIREYDSLCSKYNGEIEEFYKDVDHSVLYSIAERIEELDDNYFKEQIWIPQWVSFYAMQRAMHIFKIPCINCNRILSKPLPIDILTAKKRAKVIKSNSNSYCNHCGQPIDLVVDCDECDD